MRQALYATVVIVASAAIMDAALTKAQADRIQASAAVLQEIHGAPDVPVDLWSKASCVVVFPSVKKAAFILGGEYGKGLMSCRNGSDWSAPAFMMLEKGSIGFQIGGEAIDLVLFIMNEHGVSRLLEDKVALGGEVSVAGGPVGRDARALTDAQLKAEILSYSRSQGLFAGADVSGGVVKPDGDDNRDLYGQNLAVRDIVMSRRVKAPREAAVLMAALRRTSPPAQ